MPRSGGLRRLLQAVFGLCASATIVASPWMVGSASVHSQQLLFAGSALTLFLGALVRSCSTNGTARASSCAIPYGIAFSCGALFLGLMLCQALHPSHEVVITGWTWELKALGTSFAGPTSLAAPFDFIAADFIPYKNAWRFLLIFSVAWLYAGGLALGLVERKDALRWVQWVGVNAALLAIVCIVHRALEEKETLWHFRDTVAFTGSPVFFYKNHNGAYLAALLAVVLGLAATDKNWLRRAWEAVALGLWVATLAVNSRAAVACASLWLVIYAVWRWWAAGHQQPRLGWRTFLVAISVAGLLAFAVAKTGGRKVVARFDEAAKNPIEFIQGGAHRAMLRQVACEMWQDRPIFGWGGGSYLYLFNGHQERVPELRRQIYQQQPTLNRFYMMSADSDWVEFLVEYGIAGVALLCTASVAFLWICWRRRRWTLPFALFLSLGAMGLALHAYYDHILRNQALLLLYLSLLVVASKLACAAPLPGDGQTDAERE